MKADLYTANGEKKGSVTLNAQMFEAKVNPDLMHRAVVLRLANARKPIAHTLSRGEVSYSTKKMFRQKGTGNARRSRCNIAATQRYFGAKDNRSCIMSL